MSDLYVLTTEPPNLGMRLANQDGRLLSQTEMYMRNNFPIPDVAPTSIDVVVPGRPARKLDAAELAQYRQHTIQTVLECAGNGRRLMDPVPSGAPWHLGAASAIEIRGARLNEVLAPLPPDISEVVFTGADSGTVEPEGQIPYQFSLSRSLAESDAPLLVTHIGGEPLTRDHGAPVRLVVPGHYAMKSVKWLTRIEAVIEPFRGHFVAKYRYYEDSSVEDGAPVGLIQVRSVISDPGDRDRLSPGMTTVRGSAWTGTGKIDKVEVSLDDGATWQEAALDGAEGDAAPVRWSYEAELKVGARSIVARAIDSTGARQPMASRWNRNGYGNNVAHRVAITVD
ncbi:MAG: molybdopterin-dependent oxidoreductase [Acidobacteria bacterium]|nr:molybdopterin-dependent oxidoreductase [Acidobacteriota bacterium]